jgi:hypothetical protein
MDNKFDELVRNVTLAYTTGEKIRIKESIDLAQKLLLTDNGEINTEECREMIISTPLRLTWMTKKEIEGKEFLAIKYKDIAIEFYSTDIVHVPPQK